MSSYSFWQMLKDIALMIGIILLAIIFIAVAIGEHFVKFAAYLKYLNS